MEIITVRVRPPEPGQLEGGGLKSDCSQLGANWAAGVPLGRGALRWFSCGLQLSGLSLSFIYLFVYLLKLADHLCS